MFLNANEALEVGLLVRAIMYAFLFGGMGFIIWNAGDDIFGSTTHRWLIRSLSILCFALAFVNVFMSIEWFIVYFR